MKCTLLITLCFLYFFFINHNQYWGCRDHQQEISSDFFLINTCWESDIALLCAVLFAALKSTTTTTTFCMFTFHFCDVPHANYHLLLCVRGAFSSWEILLDIILLIKTVTIDVGIQTMTYERWECLQWER